MVCSAAVVNVDVVVHDEQFQSQRCRLFLKFQRMFIQGFSLKESPSVSFVLSRTMLPVAPSSNVRFAVRSHISYISSRISSVGINLVVACVEGSPCR
jgi:hypothetical protein